MFRRYSARGVTTVAASSSLLGARNSSLITTAMLLCPARSFVGGGGGSSFNKTDDLDIAGLRSLIHSQQRDTKVHLLDKIQTQLELALKLAVEPTQEDREEALGRGDALWAMLQPNHSLAPQIPTPTRTAVRIILAETMLECSKSIQDEAQRNVWAERHRGRVAAINPRDFEGPKQDPMSVFKFSDSYGDSGVISNTKKSSSSPQTEFYDDIIANRNKANSNAASSYGRGGGPSSPFDMDDDGLGDDEDDDDLEPTSMNSFLRDKLKADGIDRRALRAERRYFDEEDAKAAEDNVHSRNKDGSERRAGASDHVDDDEKTRAAKEKLRKLFGDENSNMNKYKQNVFNEHPLFTRNQVKKWGASVGPRYT